MENDAVSSPSGVAVGTNHGIVQTGRGARAQLLHGSVALRAPADIGLPPGGLSGLPRPARRFFVGREDQLRELASRVRDDIGVVTQAVHGLGGVGKSEVALQFATRNRTRYPLIWWIVAEDPGKIEAGLADLAFRLHPDVQVIAQQQEAATWALAWLQSHDDWLLILDNVEHRHHVEPLLGQLNRGDVLITTRRDVGWEGVTDRCLRLDVLDSRAATDLLVRLSDQADPDAAGLLAAELGYLPLALQQAGSYLRQTRVSLRHYRELLATGPTQMLARVASGDDHRRAVTRTWSLTTAVIAAEDPLAIRLLEILSCLAPDDLPRSVLHPAAALDEVDAALGILASYHMITLTAGTVAVHRLVQAVTADRTSSAWNDILRDALALLDRATPPGHPGVRVGSWPTWAILSAHVTAIAAMCPDDVGGAALARLLRATGYFDSSQARYQLALERHERVVRIVGTVTDPDDGEAFWPHLDVASDLLNLRRAADAEAWARQLLTAVEALLGPDHPTVSHSLNSLGCALLDLDRADEAEPILRRALTIAEATMEPADRNVAGRMESLGRCLSMLGRGVEAEPLLCRALRVHEAALGSDHPHVAISLNDLADCLIVQGRAAEAEPLQRRALALTEAGLAAGHPETANCLNSLGRTLRELGRSEEADALLMTHGSLGSFPF